MYEIIKLVKWKRTKIREWGASHFKFVKYLAGLRKSTEDSLSFG
jgi:hypothetical protein